MSTKTSDYLMLEKLNLESVGLLNNIVQLYTQQVLGVLVQLLIRHPQLRSSV